GRGFSVYLTNDISDVGETKAVRLGQIGTKDDFTYPGTAEYGLQIIKRTGASSYKDIVRFGASEQIIGGFTIDSDTISIGDPKLLELKATTTAGEFIISASNFQVDTAGAFT
ncbi:MAG TPA: hypothetical protein DCM40_06690, partial [Maribacter sp.]|nr:hypothetical protein [Maribacter sp.]